MATALLHEAAQELPTLGTSLGLGSQVALPWLHCLGAGPLGGPGPGWREVSHPGAQGLNYIRAGGPEIRQGPDKGQSDFQTGCQKQKKERWEGGHAEKERKEESLQPVWDTANTQSGES